MEQKPGFYDGSAHSEQHANESADTESFQMTDEMRKSIGKNPYAMETIA